MLNLILFILKFVLIFLLYLFIFSLSRNILRDSKVYDEEMPQLPASSQAKLVSLSGMKNEYDIEKLLVIGRSAEADISLGDKYVSYNHAKILSEGKDFYLEDLESTNGTLLNEKKVKRAKLKDGDTITIGKNSYKFILNG